MKTSSAMSWMLSALAGASAVSAAGDCPTLAQPTVRGACSPTTKEQLDFVRVVAANGTAVGLSFQQALDLEAGPESVAWMGVQYSSTASPDPLKNQVCLEESDLGFQGTFARALASCDAATKTSKIEIYMYDQAFAKGDDGQALSIPAACGGFPEDADPRQLCAISIEVGCDASCPTAFLPPPEEMPDVLLQSAWKGALAAAASNSSSTASRRLDATSSVFLHQHQAIPIVSAHDGAGAEDMESMTEFARDLLEAVPTDLSRRLVASSSPCRSGFDFCCAKGDGTACTESWCYSGETCNYNSAAFEVPFVVGDGKTCTNQGKDLEHKWCSSHQECCGDLMCLDKWHDRDMRWQGSCKTADNLNLPGYTPKVYCVRNSNLNKEELSCYDNVANPTRCLWENDCFDPGVPYGKFSGKKKIGGTGCSVDSDCYGELLCFSAQGSAQNVCQTPDKRSEYEYVWIGDGAKNVPAATATYNVGRCEEPDILDAIGPANGFTLPYPHVFAAYRNSNLITPRGRDDNIAFFISGDFLSEVGAEIEGKIVILGDFTTKPYGAGSMGQAGAGSLIIPSDSTDFMLIGGNVRLERTVWGLNVGSIIGVDGANIVYKGTLTKINGGKFDIRGHHGRDSNLDLSAYPSMFTELGERSKFWSTLRPNGRFFPVGTSDEYGSKDIVFKAGDDECVQVFHVLQSDLDHFNTNGGVDMHFHPNLAAKTILINVKADSNGVARVRRINYFHDPYGNIHFDNSSPFISSMLWNFYDATDKVIIGADGHHSDFEFQGSLLIPFGDLDFYSIGHSGRTVVNGNVYQKRGGSEFHNYPFQPFCPLPLPENCGTYDCPERGLQDLLASLKAGDFLYNQYYDSWGIAAKAKGSNDGKSFTPKLNSNGDWVDSFTNGGAARVFDTMQPYYSTNLAGMFRQPLCYDVRFDNDRNGDPDLGSPNNQCPGGGPGKSKSSDPILSGYEHCEAQGNVLVIQEYNNACPDDTGSGGYITVAFKDPVDITSVAMVDIDEDTVNKIKFIYASGNPKTEDTDETGDNGLWKKSFDEKNVKAIEVYYPGSGSLSGINYIPRVCEPFPNPPPPPTPTMSPTTSPAPTGCADPMAATLTDTTGTALPQGSNPIIVKGTGKNDESVLFDVVQDISGSTIPHIGLSYRDDYSGNIVCDTITDVTAGSTSSYKAGCVGGIAQVDLYVYTGSDFDGEGCAVCSLPTPASSDFRMYEFEIPCDLDCSQPTDSPTSSPTKNPTSGPTSSPTKNPTSGPTSSPTKNPTSGPTTSPTKNPTDGPTTSPTTSPAPTNCADPMSAVLTETTDDGYTLPSDIDDMPIIVTYESSDGTFIRFT
eukprot:CAMPEP_0119545366 /NCGR_PEP_ID=MMETSP1352-20130426/126_1 /TAXON_ID=265584 /ORGANISM="Stauroneis constricta, Strain CCMP1120" /LENGTH=1333 /DNA_ID=CAMNT_0007589901 /DNA_START=428 /DNA_END=4425 /DNA_ORIENTATION=-